MSFAHFTQPTSRVGVVANLKSQDDLAIDEIDATVRTIRRLSQQQPLVVGLAKNDHEAEDVEAILHSRGRSDWHLINSHCTSRNPPQLADPIELAVQGCHWVLVQGLIGEQLDQILPAVQAAGAKNYVQVDDGARNLNLALVDWVQMNAASLGEFSKESPPEVLNRLQRETGAYFIAMLAEAGVLGHCPERHFERGYTAFHHKTTRTVECVFAGAMVAALATKSHSIHESLVLANQAAAAEAKGLDWLRAKDLAKLKLGRRTRPAWAAPPQKTKRRIVAALIVASMMSWFLS